MGKTATPERQPPRIILKTKSYRIIAKDCGTFEGKKRPNDIIIERRTTNAMDEEHWGTLGEVSNRLAEPAWAACLHDLFTEVAEHQAETKKALDDLGKMQAEAKPVVITVERRPVQQPMLKSERRAKLAELLTEVAKT